MAERALREATFLILTALAAGSQHDCGITADVRAISAGRVQRKAGTSYAALDRLRTDEFIEVDQEEIVESRLRRYDRLTPQAKCYWTPRQPGCRPTPASRLSWRRGLSDE